MELTDDGKKFAFEFGTKLALSPLPKLYSSFLGRCIETAYLIDKGFTQKYGTNVEHNCVNDMLAPFYVLNIKKTVQKLQKEGNNLFLRNWFNNRIDEKIMENPEKTSDRLARFMIDRIKLLEENQIAICVSHDWSIYPLKEFKLGLKHESAGDVGYLDGILFFEKQNRYYITNYQTSPVQLK
jgi:broad specificity phosphatase PhoE